MGKRHKIARRVARKARAIFSDTLVAVNRVTDRLTGREPVVHDDPRPLKLLGFAGYRDAAGIHLHGRVLFDKPMREPGKSSWSKFRAMMALFDTDEVPGVRIFSEHEGATGSAWSDAEGYFALTIPHAGAMPSATRWESVTIETLDIVRGPTRTQVPILAPGHGDHWGVISDIDDTILETGTTNFLKNWRRILVETAEERVAVAGAADFYGSLTDDHQVPHRPFFYVSTSPWNLYPLLTAFKAQNRLPRGPMFLTDFGLNGRKKRSALTFAHKGQAIDRIVNSYPDRCFLLMGDSAQHDIDIYADAVARHPDSFAAVLIRDVEDRAKDKADKLQAIRDAGVPVHVVHDFREAHVLLAELGLEAPGEAAKAAVPDAAE